MALGSYWFPESIKSLIRYTVCPDRRCFESLLAKVSGMADLDVAAPPRLVDNHVLMLDDRNRTGLAGMH